MEPWKLYARLALSRDGREIAVSRSRSKGRGQGVTNTVNFPKPQVGWEDCRCRAGQDFLLQGFKLDTTATLNYHLTVELKQTTALWQKSKIHTITGCVMLTFFLLRSLG